jgi:undecaprenyl diphosphate synthase
MKEKIDSGNLPKHIAVIMDGNGRWAKKQGIANRVFGHRNAIKAVREISEGCAELGIGFLTLYAFSTENWERPKPEVDALMELLVHTIKDEISTLMKNNIKLLHIGEIENLPVNCQKELKEAMDITAGNTGLSLVLALSYSGRWDLVQATRNLLNRMKQGLLKPENITEETLEQALNSHQLPGVDLMIRTGGDHRISNFLLWQLSYAELYFIEDVFWPDFRKEHLQQAILDYQQRERRFGKTSEQVSISNKQ